MEIYFIRHGETEWNVQKRFQGLSNSPLTNKGLEQAKLLAEHLKDINFDRIYSSHLGRAMHTAEILKGDRKQDIEIIEDFAEIHMGAVEGIEKHIFEEKYPKEYEAFYSNHIYYNPAAYGGETFFEMRERLIRGLDKVIADNKDSERVMIVTHGAALKVIFTYLKNKSMEQLCDEEIPHNTSYTVVKYLDGKYEILDFSNISHLEKCK